MEIRLVNSYLNVKLMALSIIRVVNEISFVLNAVANAFISRSVVKHLILGTSGARINHHATFPWGVKSQVRPFALA